MKPPFDFTLIVALFAFDKERFFAHLRQSRSSILPDIRASLLCFCKIVSCHPSFQVLVTRSLWAFFFPIGAIALSKAELLTANPKGGFYNVKFLLEAEQGATRNNHSNQFMTPKSLHLLKLLWEYGSRNSVYTIRIKQGELARKLQITRQALSAHFKRLRESGFIQIGHGFLNVTEDGVRAIGYHCDPVLVLVRLQAQKRSEVSAKIKSLPAIEIFRVTGDADFVLVVEQGALNEVLQILSATEGVVDTKSYVSIETLK